jgi:hypothetical protein
MSGVGKLMAEGERGDEERDGEKNSGRGLSTQLQNKASTALAGSVPPSTTQSSRWYVSSSGYAVDDCAIAHKSLQWKSFLLFVCDRLTSFLFVSSPSVSSLHHAGISAAQA